MLAAAHADLMSININSQMHDRMVAEASHVLHAEPLCPIIPQPRPPWYTCRVLYNNI
jgi:hypothetical protein